MRGVANLLSLRLPTAAGEPMATSVVRTLAMITRLVPDGELVTDVNLHAYLPGQGQAEVGQVEGLP